jgi:ABC-type nitrate/sulfonate/bicarbonate transport system substrate-binding protein
MQQMVARQVDMGTYAGPSFAIGHEKGGLVAIAMIEYVGKTARVLARKDLGITKVEQLKGKKVANQTGSSTGNIFVDQIATKAGLKKGDYQEIRMNVNDMVAAMAAKTVDAMVNVEPYNAIAEADGLANRSPISTISTSCRCSWPRHLNFVDKNPDTVVAYLKAWLEVAKDFKQNPKQGRRHDLFVLHFKGYTMATGHLRQGPCTRGGRSGWPTDLRPT